MTRLLLISLSLFSLQTFAHELELSCRDHSGKALAFTLNLTNNSLSFSQVEALGFAQIARDQALAFTQEKWTRLNFTYDWYYTAEYTLQFDQSLRALAKNAVTRMSFSGFDDDGADFDHVPFRCRVSDLKP